VVDILKKEFRTARKEHRCDLCQRLIAKGDIYLYQTIVDGDIYNFKMCQWCYNLIEMYPEFRDVELDQGTFEDMVHGLTQEHGCEANSTPEAVMNLLRRLI